MSFSDNDTQESVESDNQSVSDTLAEDDENISITTDQKSDVYIQGTLNILNDMKTESDDEVNTELVKRDKDIDEDCNHVKKNAVMPHFTQDCEEPECDSQIDDIFEEDGKGDDEGLKMPAGVEKLGEKLVSSRVIQ